MIFINDFTTNIGMILLPELLFFIESLELQLILRIRAKVNQLGPNAIPCRQICKPLRKLATNRHEFNNLPAPRTSSHGACSLETLSTHWSTNIIHVSWH